MRGAGTEGTRGPGAGVWLGFGGGKQRFSSGVCSEEVLKAKQGTGHLPRGCQQTPPPLGHHRDASPWQRLLWNWLWVSTDRLDSFYPNAAAGLSAGAFYLLPPRLRACKGLQRFQDRADHQHPERKCATCPCHFAMCPSLCLSCRAK